MYLKLQNIVLKFDIVNFFLFYFFNELKYKTNESLPLVRFSKFHHAIITSLNKIIFSNDQTRKKKKIKEKNKKKNKSKSTGTEQRRI